MQALRLAFAAGVVLSAAPAAASLYRATLRTPTTAAVIVKETRWVCAGSACAAPRNATSPDVRVCAAVARRLGPLASFEAAERRFDADELARCNAAAER